MIQIYASDYWVLTLESGEVQVVPYNVTSNPDMLRNYATGKIVDYTIMSGWVGRLAETDPWVARKTEAELRETLGDG